MSLPPFLVEAQPTAISCRSRQGNDPDWGLFKDTICRLYETSKLDDVMRIMEQDHKFKASMKLYKTKFQEWGIDMKKIKTHEYKAILKKKRKREQDEPGKATKFRLHGQHVPEQKITRWENDKLRQGKITKNETFSEIRTPPSLIFRTPTPSIASSSPLSQVMVLHSPPAQSMTPVLSPSLSMRSPTPIPHWNELVSGFSLFSGSLDDFLSMSMDTSTQQPWRTLTPIVDSVHSPLLSKTRPAHTSRPSSSGIISSPFLNVAELDTAQRGPARSPTSSVSPWNEQGPGISIFAGPQNRFNSKATPPLNYDIEGCIFRLMQLVNVRESRVESDSFVRLLGDLQIFLNHAQAASEWSGRCCVKFGTRILPRLLNELKLTKSLLSAAPSMAINCNAAVGSFNSVPPGVIIDQERERNVIDIDSGTLTVTTNKRRQKLINCFYDVAPNGVDDSGAEITAQVMFKPKSSPTMLTLSVSQRNMLHGSVSGIPTLIINNILPSDSRVFQLAATGTVEELLSLLATGKASLRDHDTDGQSLLHFAAGNPTMCQFLVRSGLDIDECSNLYTPLQAALDNGDTETTDILLEAGADPTLDGPRWPRAISLTSMSDGSIFDRVLRQIFARSLHFGSSLTSTHGALSPLIFACDLHNCKGPWSDGFDSNRNVKKLELLLSKGCNVHDVDLAGSNCLHTYFGSRIEPLLEQNWRDSLIYLVRQGANPHALDRHGRSVFHIAYSKTCQERLQESVHGYTFGTYRGDLFDAVLHSCGYDIFDLRIRFPRKRTYGSHYSRQDFEQLWEGQQYPLADWDDVDPLIYGENHGNSDIGNHPVFICTCGEDPCWAEGYDNNDDGSDDDNDDDDDEDIPSYDNDISEGESQVLAVFDNEENVEGGNFANFATQPLGSLGPYIRNDDTDMASVHNYSTMYQGFSNPFFTDFSTEYGFSERRSQQNQEQESYELPSSVWRLADDYDMDWTSAFVDGSGPQEYSQYHNNDQQSDSLFSSPWASG